MSNTPRTSPPSPSAAALVAALPDALLAVSAAAEILSWNAGAERLFGFSADQAVGAPLIPLLCRPTEEAAEWHRWQIATASGAANYEAVLRHRDGRPLPVEVSMTHVRDAGTGAPWFAVSIREIPEINRLRTEFLANMNHELRAPLRAIIGLAELLHVGKAGPMQPDQHQCVGEILAGARNLARLIDDVLDLARIEAGRLELHPEPTNLYRLINEVLNIVRSQIARRRILVRLQCDPTVTDIVADQGRLKQVIYTFVANALKFCRDDGHMTVRVLPENNDQVRLEVEDDGPGLRPEELPLVFSEFRYLNGAATRKPGRQAFGLALSKRLVEAHGGRVGVRSEPGHGSAFFAVLPLIAARPAVEPAELTDERVLVIDDEAEDRMLIAGTLRTAGLSVETAATGSTAIDACLTRRYAAITLDLLLPDMNGWDVLRAIRAGGPNVSTPVIIISVVADQGDAAAFAVSDYVVKPAPAEELIEVLRRHGLNAPPMRTLLVLDEDPQVLEPLRSALEREGYRAVQVATPAAAAAALEQAAPDAVVFDAAMKSINGLDFVAQLRRRLHGRSVPAIVWSRQRLNPEELRRIERATLSIVSKGHGITESILREVRSAMDRRRS